MKLLTRIAVNALVVWAAFQVVSGLDHEGWGDLLIVVVLIALVNAFIGPVLKLLALPLRIMTLGLATLVINVLLVAGAIWAAESLDIGVTSTGWEATLLGALLISVFTAIVSRFVKD